MTPHAGFSTKSLTFLARFKLHFLYQWNQYTVYAQWFEGVVNASHRTSINFTDELLQRLVFVWKDLQVAYY